MEPKHIAAMTLTVLLTAACTHGHPSVQTYEDGAWRIRLEQQSDTLHTLWLDVDGVCVDSFLLPWPVYRFDCGDLTGNGIPEICVGVVKATRYHQQPARRLFIFHLFEGRYIRPLWMGSRVGHPLMDFRVCRDSTPACIHTTEMLPDSISIEREYFWRGFGLQFRKELPGKH